MDDINHITGQIVDAAVYVHKNLGPGLLESVYESVLAEVLKKKGLSFERQMPVPLDFEGVRLDESFRVDLFVEGKVVVELKSMIRLPEVCSKQVLTYLKLLNARVGLLLNFGAPTMREGIHRIANRAPH